VSSDDVIDANDGNDIGADDGGDEGEGDDE
jgi:hypothetical protein